MFGFLFFFFLFLIERQRERDKERGGEIKGHGVRESQTYLAAVAVLLMAGSGDAVLSAMLLIRSRDGSNIIGSRISSTCTWILGSYGLFCVNR